MRYEDLINTLTEVVNNTIIVKNGLKLLYEVDAEIFSKLEEHVFYSRQTSGEFQPSDGYFEIESDGVIIKVICKE